MNNSKTAVGSTLNNTALASINNNQSSSNNSCSNGSSNSSTMRKTTPTGDRDMARLVNSVVGNPSDVPIFLRKTYTIIETCNDDIASWSDKGTSFVVKDPQRFALEVIPNFFRHNNMASFVRQLNLHGFHKVRDFTLNLAGMSGSDDSQVSASANEFRTCKFRHRYFQQGRIDLLSFVQKPVQGGAAPDSREDILRLREEIANMQEQLAAMTNKKDELEALVLSKCQQRQQYPFDNRVIAEQVTPIDSWEISQSNNNNFDQKDYDNSNFHRAGERSDAYETSALPQVASYNADYISNGAHQGHAKKRKHGSENWIDDMTFHMVDKNELPHFNSTDSNTNNNNNNNYNNSEQLNAVISSVDPVLVQKLNNVIKQFPSERQESMVDSLLNMCTSTVMNQQDWQEVIDLCSTDNCNSTMNNEHSSHAASHQAGSADSDYRNSKSNYNVVMKQPLSRLNASVISHHQSAFLAPVLNAFIAKKQKDKQS